MSNALTPEKRRFNLTDEQKLSWLQLYRSQNVGPVTFRDLISHFGTAATALQAIPDLAAKGGSASKIKICDREDAEREYYAVKQTGAKLIALGEPEYPELLRSNDHSPPLICVKGDVSILAEPAVSIVGSRNASIAGMKLAERFSKELGEAGYVCASGLARGIDTQVHKGSLSSGTIAVIASGIDIVFPEENVGLAQEIASGKGALITEMPLGWQPRAQDFPRRNRIVAGLAHAVLVIEAAKRSGSLITARLGTEMGRHVLAVPGSPLDPRSEGTNQLIRNGATLVTTTDDILEAMRPMDGTQQDFLFDIKEGENDDEHYLQQTDFKNTSVDDNLRRNVISALSANPVEVDDIIRFCDATPSVVQLILLELSLAGRIEHHFGNRVSLIG